MAQNWSLFAAEIPGNRKSTSSHWLAGNFAEIVAEKQRRVCRNY
jgi:hypothetical protein